MRRHPSFKKFVQKLIILWNVFHIDHVCATNNHVDGSHSIWKSKTGQRHPAIWFFTRKLKDEQRHIEIKNIRCWKRASPPPRRRKWRDLDVRINRLKQSYNAGNHKLLKYWNAIKHCIHEFVWKKSMIYIPLCIGNDPWCIYLLIYPGKEGVGCGGVTGFLRNLENLEKDPLLKNSGKTWKT